MRFNTEKIFKEHGKSEKLSMYYAPLFSVDQLVNIIYSRLQNGNAKEIYIKKKHVVTVFDSSLSKYDMKRRICTFQEQLALKTYFDLMYYKDSYDVLLQIWLKESKNENYRRTMFKKLYKKWVTGRIGICNIISILKVMLEIMI